MGVPADQVHLSVSLDFLAEVQKLSWVGPEMQKDIKVREGSIHERIWFVV